MNNKVKEKDIGCRKEPIAIIGIAGIFPGSRTIPEFFRNVLRKRCFVRQVPDWLWEHDVFFDDDRKIPLKTYTRIGALLGDMQLDFSGFRIPPAVIDQMSWNQRLALICVREALEDAGYLKKDFDREKAGVILAAGPGELRDTTLETILVRLIRTRFGKLARNADEKRLAEALWDAYDSEYPGRIITEDTRPGESGNIVSGRIASAFDLHGPNFVLDSACASSLAAVATAVNALRAGTCDIVITGGVDTDMSLTSCIGLSKASALSANGSFPFDDRADGFVLGEGCGTLILKRFDDAVRDGDGIYALIRGCGGSSDGTGKGIMAPSSDGQLRALRRAYQDAGVKPSMLHFLECHGTGTQVGDATELDSVSRFLREEESGMKRQSSLPIGSSKAMVGHLKMAAGAAGLMRVILTLNSRVLPPQVNFEKPNSSFDWEKSGLRVPKHPEPIHADEICAGVSGFGFGGTNYHVVLSSPPVNARAPLIPLEEFILPELPPLSNDIAFLFPGQGSQYVGMLRDLRHDPTAQQFLASADEIVAGISGKNLSAIVYPGNDNENLPEQIEAREDELREADISQPAIFTVSAIVLDRVRRLGIEPGLLIGHSLGEYTALYAAGIMSFEDTLRAAATRGHLMGNLASATAGAMAFVHAGPEMINDLLSEAGGYIVHANFNSYDQTVVSGDATAVDALVELATSRGLQSRRLNVNGAFHSRLMSPCIETFREFLGKIRFRQTTIPVPANQSREVYPFMKDPQGLSQSMHEDDRQRTIDLMCRQIDHPVDFVRQIELAYEAGVRRFVEVGPKNVLSGLVSDILQGKPFQTLYLDFNPGKRLSNLRENLSAPLTIGRRPFSLKPRTVPRVKTEAFDIKVPQDLPDLVRNVVAQVSGYDVSRISDDDEFERDMGIDTLKIFEIITRLRGTVLPEKFSHFRQATSIRKILALSGDMNRGQTAIVREGPVSQSLRALASFRYQTVGACHIRDIPPVSPGRHYRVVLGPGLNVMGENITAHRQFAQKEGRDTLVLWALPDTPEDLCSQTIPDLLRLAIGIADSEMQKPGEAEVHIVTLASAEKFNPAAFRSLSGLIKSFQKDLSYLSFSYYHLDTLEPDITLLRHVLAEKVLGRHVLSDGRIEEGRLVRMPEISIDPEEFQKQLGPDDVVLVTGGAGGIAASIVRYLLPLVRSRFLLIGRRAQTEQWITEEGQGRVEYLSADLCDARAVRLLGLNKRAITLLIHAAGIGAARPIRETTDADLSQVLGVKILGLRRVLAELDISRLRGIVCLSSIAGFFGGDGHPDYAAGNAYLDGFDFHSVPVLTIGWSAWGDVGMATDPATVKFLEVARIEPIPVREGVNVFSKLLAGFLKEGMKGTQNILVRKSMGNGFFLPNDPLRAGMIETEAGLTASAGLFCKAIDGTDNASTSHEACLSDEELEAAIVSFPEDLFYDKGDMIVLKTLPAARYGLSRSDELFTPAEREEIYGVVPEARRQEKLAGKLAVKLMAQKTLKRSYGLDSELSRIQVLSSHPPIKVEIPGDSRGTAILGKMFFSISHSDGLVCAAIARQRVGIDIEKIRPLPPETAEAIYGTRLLNEIQTYAQGAQGDTVASALDNESLPVLVFTQKEAVLKAVGIGLGEGLTEVEIDVFRIGVPVTASYRGERYQVLSAVVSGYIISLASLLDEMPPQETSDKAIPLSIGQEGILFQEQLKGIGSTYNLGWSLRLKGPLNLPALARSVQYIVDRHEALRTVFRQGEGTSEAHVLSSVQISLPVADITGLPADEISGVVLQRCREEVRQRFNLSEGPLIRARLFHLNDQEHVLLFVFHHAIFDTFSELAFRRELSECYRAFAACQKPELPPLPFQYSDYARRQREGLTSFRIEQLMAYWRKKLAGVPELLELPSDNRRPAVQTFPAGSISFRIPAELLQKLQDLSRNEGVTLFVTVLAAFQVMLMRLSGQNDVVVGAPFLGHESTETLPVIGYYVNILPLRSNLSGNPRFREVLPDMRETVMEALEYQELPFRKLVEALSPRRSAAYAPIFQVVIRLTHETPGEISMPGLQQQFQEIPADNSAYDLSLIIGIRKEDGHGRIEYNRELFTEATVKLYTERFLRVLESVVENPNLRLSEIPIMASSEEINILRSWNNTDRPVPRSGIDRLFTEQAERTPDAIALVQDHEHLTYRELNERANQLAGYLLKKDITRGKLVGLCMERSIEAVISMIGIVKAGGAYLPLDPDYPVERLSVMIKDSQPSMVLTQETFRAKLSALNLPVTSVDKARKVISQESDKNPVTQTHPDDLVYVMYTSGSTGGPKGVAIPHRAVVRLVLHTDYIQLASSDKMAQISNMSFDAATFEIWGALLNGACLCIIPKHMILSPKEFASQIQKQKISVLFMTTALFNLMTHELPEAFSTVKYLLFGGEAADAGCVRKMLEEGSPDRLLHMYGPTENTTFTTWYPVKDVMEHALTVPIGRPIANTNVYILDKYLQPVPVGVTGELCIGGEGLALGYLNNHGLTEEKFIQNPFKREQAGRLYKTGDIARYLPDGNIEFMGRLDNQVKIRGFRIEPAEIEAMLRQHPAVRDSIVIAGRDQTGGKRLIAYVVSGRQSSIPEYGLRDFLMEKLPEYMVPSRFVMLDSFPLTPNGKVDRQALSEMEKSLPETRASVAAPRNKLERELSEAWKKVLNLQEIGITENFFALGGHSLLAVQLMAEIKKMTGHQIPVIALFQSPTIEQLAQNILKGDWPEEISSPVRINPGASRTPLFWVYDTFLAGHFGEDQPLYVVHPSVPDEELTSPSTVEEMAARYLREIRSIQPKGPYLLGGYCFWAVVALEMARQLTQQGDEVPFLFLVEPSIKLLPANCRPADSSFRSMFAHHSRNLASRKGRDKVTYFRKKLPFVVPYLKDKVMEKYKTALCNMYFLIRRPLPVNLRIFYTFNCYARLPLDLYTPDSYPGRVIIFQTENAPAGVQREWDRIVSGKTEIHEIPGAGHLSIMQKPHVITLAGQISAYLDHRESEKHQ